MNKNTSYINFLSGKNCAERTSIWQETEGNKNQYSTLKQWKLRDVH